MKEYVESVLRLADWVGVEHVGWATDQIEAGLPEWFRRYTELPQICAALLDGGFSEQDLIRFIGGNLLRVYDAVVFPNLAI